MKKGIAILLTVVMLLTGIQPVLSLHLCAGTLFSTGFFEASESSICCEEPMAEATLTSSGNSIPAAGSTTDNVVYHEVCCEFQTIEISTDDFSRVAEQQTIHNLTQVTGGTWAVMASLPYRVIPDNSLTIRHHFPPVGLGRLTTDLLTYICIYRI